MSRSGRKPVLQRIRSNLARSSRPKARSNFPPAGTRITLRVVNTGDRPVQIGSHYHFLEVNKALEFDRAAAFGMRLDIPAGTAVRFEPGQSKEITLVGFGGRRELSGLNALTDGNATDHRCATLRCAARANPALKAPEDFSWS